MNASGYVYNTGGVGNNSLVQEKRTRYLLHLRALLNGYEEKKKSRRTHDEAFYQGCQAAQAAQAARAALCGDCSTQRSVAQNDRGKGHYIEGFPEPVQLRFLSVERRAQPEWEQ